ncbi:MAG: UDP-N-acetylglucosamine 1-carboxyvinyltransferase [Boseongicola sp. SB0677_bin_26]|nr:UDP-N-acetylglucosamine 1-carboxyvinyltransferase [Boseongicola sp. SB0665_bin_10]MYG28849.1 UDP-N-acetylglucosamine 1-carboxyvinyltransferase [Boseongicola sp. SB0677_bin_26]
MDSIVVTGGASLNGQIPIAGAKNSCLALMPATLLTEEPLVLMNAPRLSDIDAMGLLLRSLGVHVQASEDGKVITMRSGGSVSTTAEYDIVRKMRASNLVLGPLLAREGQATVSLPGGCAIGARPMDVHVAALEALGARIELKDGYLHATAPRGLKGARVTFRIASVGATENVLMAATLAKGTTVIENAACEPEIVDLAECLTAMGARIEGAGTSIITIEGASQLGGARHTVIADRIELGTYMMAPAICGGEVECLGGRMELVRTVAAKLEEAGVSVEETGRGIRVARGNDRIRPLNVRTESYPGFPTDLQAQMMALLCIADGVSQLEETIFENRFMHAPELMRMGADIDVRGGTATVTGVKRLKGAPVMATDLRASVSLILAGLGADDETVVNRVYHLDRGYEHVEEKLGSVGAKIERIQN